MTWGVMRACCVGAWVGIADLDVPWAQPRTWSSVWSEAARCRLRLPGSGMFALSARRSSPHRA